MSKTLPEREGLYVWRTRRDADSPSWASDIVRDVRAAEINDLFIKVANANYAYNAHEDSADLEFIFSSLRGETNLWGWHYIYLNDPIGEAKIARRMIEKWDLAGYVINAEGHTKGKDANALTFMRKLRDMVGSDYPLGLSSYRYPNYHPTLPWKVFLGGEDRVDFNAPQVYWLKQQNSVEQIDLTIKRTKAHEAFIGVDHVPIHPILCAFSDNPHEWKPKETSMIDAFQHCKEIGLTSVSWYEWVASHKINRWDVIQNYTDWEGAPEPPPQDDTPYTQEDLEEAYYNGYVEGWKERKEAISKRIFGEQEMDVTFPSSDSQ